MALTVAVLAAKVRTLPSIGGVAIIDSEDPSRVSGVLLTNDDEPLWGMLLGEPLSGGKVAVEIIEVWLHGTRAEPLG